MPFYIRVPSPIIPVHSITQTEEPDVKQLWLLYQNQHELELMTRKAIAIPKKLILPKAIALC
ncbi:hypothetical protein H0901_04680 [Microcystis aeruginosa BLCCF158]|uniref:Uncharacterized protein n=1 Tax=Microcystis aeruginosa BLCC-F158 TaxID=2755316 RepID=A0A841UWY9_MICAE|nr:hypothetical protein [Microcystis aeruginosa]MBC1194598.1 hypothetical protein [Microcystis aeruginosa BLCC-F158]